MNARFIPNAHQPVLPARRERPALTIDLCMLPGGLKRVIWDWMKINRPEQSEFLGSDIHVAFRDRLDAHALLSFTREEVGPLLEQHPNLTRYAT